MTTLRYGIIGSGMMGVEHIENLSHTEGVEVTAIADPDLKPRVRGALSLMRCTTRTTKR